MTKRRSFPYDKHFSTHAPTLDEWSEQTVPDLEGQVRCHVEQYVDNEEDREGLTRLVMISVRQEIEAKFTTKKKS